MYRKIMQTSVAAAALFAFTAAYSAPASAADDSFKSGNKNALKMSGQVNRAVMWVDNGDESEFFHVDNDNSSTRIRWVGKASVTDNVDVGLLWETQFESNSTANVNFAGNDGDAGPGGFGERKMDVWLDHKDFGKLTLGQGDPASNGTAEITLSGTDVILYAGIADTAGGIKFRSSTTTGPSIGAVWGNQHDGRSRTDRIRYDSPKFMGFMASASHIQGGLWDVVLRHAGKFGQFKTKAAIAYTDLSQTSGTNEDQVNGSIAVLHDSGLNVTFSAGTRDNTGKKDDDHIYVALGYIAKLTSLGTTRFAVDYGNADDVAADGDDFETFGIAMTQNLKEVSTDLYITFRNHQLDRTAPNTNFDDINVVIAGGRVKF